MCNDSSQGVPAAAPAAAPAAVQQPVAAAFVGASATRLHRDAQNFILILLGFDLFRRFRRERWDCSWSMCCGMYL